MRVFACFLRFWDSGPHVLLYGEFEYVDLLFFHDGQISLFYTRPHEKYARVVRTKDDMAKSVYWTEKTEILELPLSFEEGQKLMRTCETFALVGIPYNLLDCILYVVPIRVPEERPLFQAQKLSDVQGTILMLRECLPSSHPVLDAMKSLNSRQTLASTLFDTLLPVTQRLTWGEMHRLLNHPA